MLMQPKIILSECSHIYDRIIPKDNMLRKIKEMVEITVEKNIIKSKSTIVDSTYTKAKYNQKTPREVLIEQSKLLRKLVTVNLK
jgi:hypothetical protein